MPLAGRYRSGAPLELAGDQPGDPGLADPAVLGDDAINNFEYKAPGDADGLRVPRAAHIRKAYPRDEDTPGGGEEDTQCHRLMRRGTPFGLSFRHGARVGGPRGPNPQFPEDRGLLFLCYGRSIEQQFEVVQRDWVGSVDFPQAGDGVDPVLAEGSFQMPGAPQSSLQLRRWVTTTGGDYFFSPSISALKHLAGVQ